MLILFPEGQQRSGKIGSLTFSKRGYVSPTKLHSLPKNHVNTKVQSTFQLISASYKDGCLILPGFKEAWDAYSVIMMNRVGNPITLSGKAAFIRINMNLSLSGQTPIAFPNVNSVAPSINNLHTSITSITGHYRVNLSPDSSLHSVNIYCSPCFSTGKIAADENMFRKVFTGDYSVLNSVDVGGYYHTIFGKLRHLARISTRVQAVSSSGICSIVHQENRIVT